MPQMKQVFPVKINDECRIQAEVQMLGGEEEVSASTLTFEGATEAIEGIARRLSTVFANIKPDKASVEFGIQLTVKEGKLTALLVSGEGTASMKIALQWRGTKGDGNDPDD